MAKLSSGFFEHVAESAEEWRIMAHEVRPRDAAGAMRCKAVATALDEVRAYFASRLEREPVLALVTRKEPDTIPEIPAADIEYVDDSDYVDDEIPF
jgi:hypothetical protein